MKDVKIDGVLLCKLSKEQLKAHAYDRMKMREQMIRELAVIEGELAAREVPDGEPKETTP